ncbi:RecF/RecN/SMC protein [Metschnikowia bicuspidata var. bicuspidata NRRL YB-4993]|uniref:Structural maintenance of chromosomes protein n=1 Tax=Metschnikowia bicuspidata var. bicuspidata NRRL YB-4993 TaxID=869754 RepID=A0A1A0HD37_9ASCO|nr:RecF/RecN/SMC protein [Metschnikowia bicuspidata var. bicuspidata NRRL YB-4993]OBA21807.1 RecF/RecN/SMC protein [Metschnikowia bicuspidata var. bicuspidata NRRL YB-4993]
MGRLVGLELHNFKSYKGTAKIGFGDASFTSIIGPNGAGKSNMMDAISFVLGVQSSHLRSHQLKDLIYRGRIDGTDNLAPSLKAKSAYVCAFYEKDSGEMLTLKRVINSSGSSDYRLNDKNVTALQYSMALRAENILVKARNFLVFQGDIENVASQSAKDLANLIETISGSIEYAAEYDQLKEDLERAREVATQVFSRKRTLNSESKQYKEQMREQDLFESKLNEKYSLIKILHLYRIFHNQKRHYMLVADLRRISDKLDEVKAQHSAKIAAQKSTVAEVSKATLASKKLEAEKNEKANAAETVRRALLPIASSKRSLESSITLASLKLRDLQTDLQNLQDLKEAGEQRLSTAESDLAQFEKEVQESSDSINIPPGGVAEYEALHQKFLANSGSSMLEKLTMLSSDKESLVSSMQNYTDQKNDATTRISELESEIRSNFVSTLSQTKSKLDDLIGERVIKIKEKEDVTDKLKEISYRELDLTTKINRASTRLDELSSQQNESNKQKKLRDNVSMLRNLVKEGSIKGLMYELVRCSQQKYDLALQTSLGRNFDSIVVESTAVAYKCIEILKERRAGTATFIPLDSVVTDQINLNYLRSLDEGARPALDVVKYDDQSLERAVQFALGNTIIVDELDIARDLKWNLSHQVGNKMVALDGSIIHTSGLMSGGQQAKSGNALTWSKQEWLRLKKEKEELSENLAKLQSEKPSAFYLNDIVDEIRLIDEEIPSLKSKIVSLEREISERNHEISFQKEMITEIETKEENTQRSLTNMNHQLLEVQSEITGLQVKIYFEFCQKYNLESISQYEFFLGTEIRARARKRAELQRVVSVCKNRLSFQIESIDDMEIRIQRLIDSQSRIQSDLQRVNDNLSHQTEMMEELEKDFEQLTQESEASRAQLSKLMRESNSLVEDMEEDKLEIKTLSEELASCKEFLLKVDTERINMLKNCKIESVDLPLEEGFLESISLDDEPGNVSVKAYLIHVDYGLLELKLQESFSPKVEAEITVKLDNIQTELEVLTPNSKAIERLKEVDQRIKEFDREFTKARQDEKRSTTKFNEIKALRTQRFMEAFTHISENIDRVYKELTKSSTSPIGGSADLTLEDEDEPYAAGIRYHAMPPMKRFRDMDLLSGGEKTMAALSLLFAIHSFHPSPFFVLDEIDAALDNLNVDKIANYIKRHAGPGFQFIVISLKSSLFENSDALIGIYREQRENSSRTISLDLRRYSDEPHEIELQPEGPALASS